jgi:cytidyltransferase-like protein
MKTAMAFGVFDGLHEGHRDFLRQAMGKCDRLIVVVAPSEAVMALKGRMPKRSYDERAAALRELDPSLVIVPSDAEIGSWKVVRDHRPDVVFLGHDQQAIAGELARIGVPFEFLESHEPERFKSSILNRS